VFRCSRLRLNGGADDSDCGGEVVAHELVADAKDPVAEPPKPQVAARVRMLAAGMIGAVDFDDETNAWREKVSDEPAADGHLAAE